MEFDISKLERMSLSKKKNENIEFSEEEKKFMKYIFDSILNSDNQDTIIEYLAKINDLSISDIKFIRNVYLHFFASKEELIEYTKIKNQKTKARRKEGFIDISAMISITTVISVLGITLAFVLYNLI